VADDVAPQEPQRLAVLELEGNELPVYDLAEFNAADLDRVQSFSTNFGRWRLPGDVAGALGVNQGSDAALEWIHDTGELVLLGGVPSVREVEVDTLDYEAMTSGNVPGFIGGSAAGIERDASGNVRELFKSAVMPAGSRVAVLAHIKHGPKVHELLWGWHRQHGRTDGWNWLVERLARLASAPPEEGGDHLG
jgi:hypothetical protein